MEMRFFRCRKCGQMAALLKASRCPVCCCGEPMEELVAGTTEASREKHIPVNVSADQTKCDFFFPGIARHNNLVAGITACGTDHRLAKRAAEAVRDLFETIE